MTPDTQIKANKLDELAFAIDCIARQVAQLGFGLMADRLMEEAEAMNEAGIMLMREDHYV